MIKPKAPKSRSKFVKRKPTYDIDGKSYASSMLLSMHQLLTDAKQHKLIQSFTLPEGVLAKTRYRSIKCEIDGMVFDSLMEGRYYVYLKELQKTKIVSSFECQHSFELQPRFKKAGKTIRPITYIADFLVQYENGRELAVDVKGMITKEFALKHKMFDYKFPNTELELVQYRVKAQTWVKIA